MVDIGIVGLDTSHSEAFAEALSSMEPSNSESDITISAVWDDGSIRDTDYRRRFCDTFEAVAYDEPGEMIPVVDAVLVLTVDWERHVPIASQFLEADIPTLVDKPIAGRATELTKLVEAATNAPLFGGSALPFHPSLTPLSNATGNRTLHLAGYNDYFYYRVHLVDTVRRLVNASWTSVAPIENTQASAVGVSFDDGTWATLRFDGSTDDAVFAALDVADRTRAVTVAASERTLREMYTPYLEQFMEVVRGTVAPSTEPVIDAARLLLAVEASLSGKQRVTPTDDTLEEIEIPSDQFLDDYEPYY